MPCRTCVLAMSLAIPADVDPWGGPWATHIPARTQVTLGLSRNVYGSGDFVRVTRSRQDNWCICTSSRRDWRGGVAS